MCDMCFKSASEPDSVRAVGALEAPRPVWIVYTLMRSQVDYRYEPLSATRKRTFQNARVRSVLSGDVCLKVQLVRKGFPTLLTYRSVALALVYAPDMIKHVEPVSV